jgi:uncharacterized membrane-anchored protein YitT (DUF2179 family)
MVDGLNALFASNLPFYQILFQLNLFINIIILNIYWRLIIKTFDLTIPSTTFNIFILNLPPGENLSSTI